MGENRTDRGEFGGRDGVKDKKGARGAPASPDAGGRVRKGAGGARSTPLDVRSGSSIIIAYAFFFSWPAMLDSLDGLEPRVRFLILNSTFYLVLIHLSTLYRGWVLGYLASARLVNRVKSSAGMILIGAMKMIKDLVRLGLTWIHGSQTPTTESLTNTDELQR